jgi:iron complex transport system substrate-binding protein
MRRPFSGRSGPNRDRRTRTPYLSAYLSALLVTAFFGLASACAPKTPDPEEVRGTEVQGPRRIVSLVPTATEILFAIGAGDRVVGVSDFDSYPPEALDRPRVGALINPNMEMILSLEPDLVVTYGTQSLLHDRLGEVGIAQFPFVSGPADHVIGSIRTLGDLLGLEEGAEEVSREIESTIERLRATRPPESPRVLLVHSRDMGSLATFYSAGADSYFGELIEIAGGQNLFGDVSANAFQPSLEEVISRQPEVIVELVPSDGGGEDRVAARRRDWDRLTSVPAVAAGRVHVLAGDYLLLVGPRLHLVAEAIAGAVRTESVT